MVPDVAVLSAIGIGPDKYLRVSGVSCVFSEAELHWGAFFESLLKRGMSGLQFVVSDDHSGLKASRKAVFTLPENHRRRLRTSNPVERVIQQELKRRTHKVRIFPNTESLERVVSSVLVKIDDKWVAANKGYIKWELQDD